MANQGPSDDLCQIAMAFVKLYTKRRGVASAYGNGINISQFADDFPVNACEALVECTLNHIAIYSEHIDCMAKMVTDQPIVGYSQRLNGVITQFNSAGYTEPRLIAWWCLCGELACKAFSGQEQQIAPKQAAILVALVNRTHQNLPNINWGIFVDYQRCILSWDFVPRCWYKATALNTTAVSGMVEMPFRNAAAYSTREEALWELNEAIAKYRDDNGLTRQQINQMRMSIRVQEMPTIMQFLDLANDYVLLAAANIYPDDDSSSDETEDSEMNTEESTEASTEASEDGASTDGEVSQGGVNHWDDASEGTVTSSDYDLSDLTSDEN